MSKTVSNTVTDVFYKTKINNKSAERYLGLVKNIFEFVLWNDDGEKTTGIVRLKNIFIVKHKFKKNYWNKGANLNNTIKKPYNATFETKRSGVYQLPEIPDHVTSWCISVLSVFRHKSKWKTTLIFLHCCRQSCRFVYHIYLYKY